MEKQLMNTTPPSLARCAWVGFPVLAIVGFWTDLQGSLFLEAAPQPSEPLEASSSTGLPSQ